MLNFASMETRSFVIGEPFTRSIYTLQHGENTR